MASVNVTIRMDEDMKRQADDLFSDLGMSLSGAVTVFVKQAIRQQAIPFIIGRDMPNRETIEKAQNAFTIEEWADAIEQEKTKTDK